MSAPSLIRLTLLAALWGGAFLLMRLIVPTLGVPMTAFGRVTVGALGLLALVLASRTPLTFKGRLRDTLVLGAINSGLPFLMYALAARTLPAGYSAILNATTPLMGVVIGAAAFGERLSVAKFAGVFCGLAGVWVLTSAGPLTVSAAVLWGVGACLVATTCYALAGFLTKRWITDRGGLDSRLVALGSQMGAALLLAPVLLWDLAMRPVSMASLANPVAWWALVALGLLCTSLAYVLYFRLIADIGPLKALSVTFLIPVFGVFWGWLVLDESVNLAHAIGGGLIGLALCIVLRAGSAGTAKVRSRGESNGQSKAGRLAADEAAP